MGDRQVPRVAAVDSTGGGCSVALHVGDVRTQLDGGEERARAEHLLDLLSELLGGPLRGPQAPAGTPGRVDALAFGRGPGAFTSVRCAAALAHGLALGTGVPLVPVSTLEALAARSLLDAPDSAGTRLVLALTDARLGEVYCGLFSSRRRPGQRVGDGLVPLADEAVSAPGDAAEWAARAVHAARTQLLADAPVELLCVGSGVQLYASELDMQALCASFPGIALTQLPQARADADAVATLAVARLVAGEAGVAPEQAQPAYLRERVADVPARLRRSRVL